MDIIWFYLKLGLTHVLDPGAYDHVLFLAVLAAPFTLSDWRKAVWLATLFTIAHCLSLALSAFGVIAVDPSLVEKLIPITIVITALWNVVLAATDRLDAAYDLKNKAEVSTQARDRFSVVSFGHQAVTVLFGLIHGLGFSNYFNMLMAGESDKVVPLLGFAFGIEVAQVIVILAMLSLMTLLVRRAGRYRNGIIVAVSLIVFFITLRLLVQAFQ